MAAGNFLASLALTLPYEGGWSDNPRDPGGATMCGVTQAVYDAYRDARHLPRRSVRESTSDERAAIYRARYWGRAQCEAMPAGLDFALFDFAVHSGVGRAVRTLQHIVGTTEDGVAGAYTLAAVDRMASRCPAGEMSDMLCHQRLVFLQGLATYADFGRGWRRRVMGEHDGAQAGDTGVIDHAYAMALQRTLPAVRAPEVTPKTYAVAA